MWSSSDKPQSLTSNETSYSIVVLTPYSDGISGKTKSVTAVVVPVQLRDPEDSDQL